MYIGLYLSGELTILLLWLVFNQVTRTAQLGSLNKICRKAFPARVLRGCRSAMPWARAGHRIHDGSFFLAQAQSTLLHNKNLLNKYLVPSPFHHKIIFMIYDLGILLALHSFSIKKQLSLYTKYLYFTWRNFWFFGTESPVAQCCGSSVDLGASFRANRMRQRSPAASTGWT